MARLMSRVVVAVVAVVVALLCCTGDRYVVRWRTVAAMQQEDIMTDKRPTGVRLAVLIALANSVGGRSTHEVWKDQTRYAYGTISSAIVSLRKAGLVRYTTDWQPKHTLTDQGKAQVEDWLK